MRPVPVLTSLVSVSLIAASCGGGGGASTPPAVTELASASIGAAGGTLAIPADAASLPGAAIDIPAGALADATTISISAVTGRTGMGANVLVADLGPTGTTFAVPVAVTIPYDAAYLAANTITDTSTLKVVASDDGIARETLLTIAQDDTGRTVTAGTMHFSQYSVLGYSDATLDGSYKVVDFYFRSNAAQGKMPDPGTLLPTPLGYTTGSLALNFNGAGAFSMSGKQNHDGTVSVLTNSGDYTIAADGTLTIAGTLKGAALAGGSVFIAANAATAVDPEIIIGIKSGGTAFSNASLDGTYRIGDYTFASQVADPLAPAVGSPLPTPQGYTGSLLSVTFDGAGGYAMTGTQNRDGIASAISGSGTYTVTSGGAVTFGNLTGALMAGGGALALSSASGDPEMAFGIKAGAPAFSDASLKGTYKVTDYNYAAATTQPNAPAAGTALPSPKGFTGALMTLTFDGAGNYTMNGTQDRDGGFTAISESGTYAVDADGSLTLSNMSGQVMTGGSAFVLVSTSGDPEIAAGILQ